MVWHSMLLLTLISLLFVRGTELDFAAAPQLRDYTSGQPQPLGAQKYGAIVERVNLAACPNVKEHISKFYKRFVSNSRAFKFYVHTYGTSIANHDPYGNVISSATGPGLMDLDLTVFHTWDSLKISATDDDLRIKEPRILNITTWNGLPQIYIPLYLKSSSTGDAYMLHIYPEEGMVGNTQGSEFADGVLWARYNDVHRMYHVKFDLASIFRDLVDFQSPNYKKYYQAFGNVYIDPTNYYHPEYANAEQIGLRSTAKGGSTELICGGSAQSLGYTWSEFESILKTQFLWL